jgi:hypothetical protein
VSPLKYLRVPRLVERVSPASLVRWRRDEERTRNGWRELGFPKDMWPAFLDSLSIYDVKVPRRRPTSTVKLLLLLSTPPFDAICDIRVSRNKIVTSCRTTASLSRRSQLRAVRDAQFNEFEFIIRVINCRVMQRKNLSLSLSLSLYLYLYLYLEKREKANQWKNFSDMFPLYSP